MPIRNSRQRRSTHAETYEVDAATQEARATTQEVHATTQEETCVYYVGEGISSELNSLANKGYCSLHQTIERITAGACLTRRGDWIKIVTGDLRHRTERLVTTNS